MENNKILHEADDNMVKERQRSSLRRKKPVDMAKKEIEELKLEMKLINVHYMLGRKRSYSTLRRTTASISGCS
jgi:cell fate regulator YaaT (PSP1 superfamily)